MICNPKRINHPVGVFTVLALLASTAQAEQIATKPLTWSQTKCVLYNRAWDSAVLTVDQTDISKEFHDLNQRFMDSDCTARINVCPHSDAEFEIANLLTIMTMNEGMASTFVPFNCPADD